ncbi:MAG: hypothetical protein E7074_05265 [Bacteroidales bacterium]|jgi:hypothetical protein|nr:hypothetical protein [Bacteroidales bacterium]
MKEIIKMENVVLSVSPKQLIMSNSFWILLNAILAVVMASIFSSYPKMIFLGVFLFMMIYAHIFNRNMWRIVEIAVDDNEIVLTYYRLWVKKSLSISRKTFGKILVESSNTKLSLNIYDKRWVLAPCMNVQYSENKFDYLVNNICESREAIEKAIALLEKYNYHIEFENK